MAAEQTIGADSAVAPSASTGRLVSLLTRAGEAHHHAFAATGGDDPTWPAWYADWLLRHGAARELGSRPSRRELSAALAAADEHQRASGGTDPWQRAYAVEIQQQFGAAQAELA